MKYDSSIVGEGVITPSGKEGTIISVSKDGAVKVRFNGDAFGGEYMFDPFLSGHIKFINAELQALIDAEIEGLHQEQLARVKACVAQSGEKATFYITKDKADGTKETVYRLKCDKDQAYDVFGFVVMEQQKEYRASGFSIKWRVVRMFDCKTNEQICQES